MLRVKIKKTHKDAVIPKYSKPGDAGMDLTAVSKVWNTQYRCFEYNTGISVEIPEGYVGLVFPRSSIYKYKIQLSNSVGVIDSGYRGEIKFIFNPFQTTFAGVRTFFNLLFERKEALKKGTRMCYSDESYNIGDRIGQLIIIPYPTVEFEEVEELSQTERGEGGFGSTNV